MRIKRFLGPFVDVPVYGSVALLILRLIAGIGFAMHGWGKIQHPMSWMGPQSTIPGFFQLLAAVSEFGGGLAWIVGLLTPLASLGIAFTMAVAVYMQVVVFKAPFVASTPGENSYELAAVFLGVALVLLAIGPGRFSLDKVLFRRW